MSDNRGSVIDLGPQDLPSRVEFILAREPLYVVDYYKVRCTARHSIIACLGARHSYFIATGIPAILCALSAMASSRHT